MTGELFGWQILGGIGIAIAVAWAISDRLARIKLQKMRTEWEEWEAEKEEHNRNLVRMKQELALTCRRCGKLAVPIVDTGNRYRCENCGNQFAGASHGLHTWPGDLM
jgi:hypothetical protein